MILDPSLYRAALVQLGPDRAVFVEASAEFLNWLAVKQLPMAVRDFLAGNALADGITFPSRAGGMWHPSDIMALNDQEAAMLEAGLLALGNAISGDFIVLDLQGEQRAGFVSHDELWDSSPVSAREIYAPVADSLHELLFRVSQELREWHDGSRTQPGYPIDYCTALPGGLEE